MPEAPPSPELMAALEEQTRALAAALGIRLPEEFSLYQTRLVMANAVPRVVPLGKGPPPSKDPR